MLLTNSLACLQAWRVRFGLLGALICLLVACEKVESTDEKNPVPNGAVRLLFTYSSEKEDWVKDVTATFNQGKYKTKAGKPIYVDAIAEGSGECIDKIINDSQKADLVSPASEVFVRLGNSEGRAKLGREVIGPTRNLVLSPLPLSDYRPTAEQILSSLFASGGCSLYDTLSLAYQHVQRQQEEAPSRIAAIVVLRDGKDTTSKLTLEQLLAQIRDDFDQHAVRVFTIGYEAENGTDALKQISEVTQGRYYEGKQTNIREIFKDISTFF